MKCHVCGSAMRSVVTDLPFKVHHNTLVVLKNLPVLQCEGCHKYFLVDPVMQRVDEIIAKVDMAAELEVIKYAA